MDGTANFNLSVMKSGKKRNDERRHPLAGKKMPLQTNRFLSPQRREVKAQIFGESNRSRGNWSGKACKERRPSAQKRRKWSVGFPQEGIFAAGTRELRAQFGIAQRSQER